MKEHRTEGEGIAARLRTLEEENVRLEAENLALRRELRGTATGGEALRESEARLRKAQEIAHLGSWELDLASNSLTWSDEVYRIFGLEPQQFGASYEAFLQAVHPDDRAAVDAAYSCSLREGRDSYEIEHRIIRRSTGEIRTVHERCEHLRDASGRIVRSIGMILDVTERKRIEGALRRRESTLEQAGQMAHLGAWDIEVLNHENLSANTLTWSDEVYRIFGYEPKSVPVTNDLFFQHVHPDDRDVVAQAVAKAIATRGVYDIEHRIVRPDGQDRVVEEHAEILFDEQGRPRRIIGAIQDITDRKRVETAAKQREAQFRALIENVNAGVALIDALGQFVLFNRQFLDLFGLSSEADIHNVNSQDWSAWQVFDEAGVLLHVDDHPVRRAFLTRQTVREQLVRVRLPRGGEDVWLVTSAQPLFDADGRVEHVICTYHDVSDRKRAEAFLSFALTTARTGAWDLDLVTHSAHRSLEHDQIFGYEEILPEWSYEMFLEHVLPEDRADVDTGFRRALETGGDWSFECRIRRRGGEVRWIWGAGRHRLDDRGRPRRMAGIVQDITDRKEAEAALLEADRRKDEFLAVLSHELRNPLAPVRNSIHVLERAAPGGEQAKRALAVVDRQVTHLTRLVDDLLDATRIARGKVQLHRQRVELGELVRRAVEDHRALVAAHGLELRASITTAPLSLEADPTRVEQIVGNLVQNAVKFTPQGGRIETELWLENRWATLVVRDTGLGIARDMMGRLFEPFAQADRTLDRSRGGLGLGLALVKGLVELHGGSVTAASEGPGRGATFTVRLPVVAPMAPTATTSAAATGLAGRRILIIEDNVDSAASLADALELDGHRVAIAHDGPDGLAKASDFKPEVVLCDIGLPGMDGYAVARALRASETLRDVLLVALTGYALPEDVARAAEAGFDRHLAKPPSLEQLERVLAEARRGSR